MTIGEMMDRMEEGQMVLIRTGSWKMENALSVGTMKQLMWDTIEDMKVRLIATTKDNAIGIWTHEDK